MWLMIAVAVGFLSWWITAQLVHGGSWIRSLDHPNERSLHVRPTPRTGGVAMVVSLLAGTLTASAMAIASQDESSRALTYVNEALWILGPTFFLALVSFCDDRLGLPVAPRFALQVLAACGMALGGHMVIPAFTIPGWGVFDFGWASLPLTVLFVLWMTNLYNFMDGMDGFAGGMTVIGFGLLGYFGWVSHHPLLFGIAVLQTAAAVGFLAHNFPPAKIFMGDVGSISTGFLAGALIVLGCRDAVFDLWVPLIIFSPFILDATVTLLRRALRGERIWEAHRDHFYQRVVLSGWGHRKTVSSEYAIMALCAALAITYHSVEQWQPVVLGAWVVLFGILAFTVTLLEARSPKIQPE